MGHLVLNERTRWGTASNLLSSVANGVLPIKIGDQSRRTTDSVEREALATKHNEVRSTLGFLHAPLFLSRYSARRSVEELRSVNEAKSEARRIEGEAQDFFQTEKSGKVAKVTSLT